MKLALALLALAGVARAAPQIDSPAPVLDLPALDGTTVRTESFRGHVVVVDFFATWCAPCHEAIAALDKLARATGVALVIVDVGEPPETVRAYFAQHPPPPGARVALDGDGAAGRRFGQNRFPTTFLVDGNGVIRFINRGFGPGYAARVSRWLASMLH